MSLSESEKKSVLSMLAQVPLFSSLDKKSLSIITNAGTRRSYKAGDVIVKSGDMATAFYLILDGNVEVRKGTKVLAKLGKGGFFGEMALFDRQPRSADVVSTNNTSLLLLTSWAFDGIVNSNPKVAWFIVRVLVGRLRETNRALTE